MSILKRDIYHIYTFHAYCKKIFIFLINVMGLNAGLIFNFLDLDLEHISLVPPQEGSEQLLETKGLTF